MIDSYILLLSQFTRLWYLSHMGEGFSYFSEIGARGLLNLGKYHLDNQN